MYGRAESRGFTLIEMLVVVAVIAILMTITMRLTNVGKADEQRNQTLIRMHCIENCLSGYYAAFGAYPQVKLHGSRDIYLQALEGNNSQGSSRNPNMWSDEGTAWQQVQNACRSQPVGAKFPFSKKMSKTVKKFSQKVQRMAASGKYPKISGSAYAETFKAGFDALDVDALTRFTADQRKATDWREIKLFQFGLCSFLLPRFLVMMGGDEEIYDNFAQWDKQNKKPSDPLSGNEMKDWKELHGYVAAALGDLGGTPSLSDMARVVNIPSQAVCARWIANLEGLVNDDTWGTQSMFGITIGAPTDAPMFYLESSKNAKVDSRIEQNLCFPDPNSRTRGVYLLDSCTLLDGFGTEPNYQGNEFYYYSPLPYQSYTFWSAGANGKTFPPWVSLNKLKGNATAIAMVTRWISDDIVRLSH